MGCFKATKRRGEDRVGSKKQAHVLKGLGACCLYGFSSAKVSESKGAARMLTGVNLLGVFQGGQHTAKESGKPGEMADYYQVLGVSRDAQPYQILTAYNKKLEEVRPAC